MSRLFILVLVCAALARAELKAVFYMTQTPDSIRSFLDHAAQVGILVPTVYSVDENGLVWGALDSRVLDAAREHHVPVMPIIVNPGFNPATIHAVLTSADARQRMIAALYQECSRFHYYGIQFDFEHVAFTDRDALTRLVRETATAFAAGGFKLSIATVHAYSDFPGAGAYAHWLYAEWRGSYDLRELAKYCDFISVMAYDQHTGHTTPGPVAGFPWVRQILQYSAGLMPKEKISLGIALYGRRWYAGMQNGQGAMQISSVNGPAAMALAAANSVQPLWDDVEKAPWFFYYVDSEREYVFYNDARSFQARYDLARSAGLHGFSAWVLGAEDPAIWSVLPVAAK
jgi:spore germination protein YaaH